MTQPKQILFDAEAREKLRNGIDQLAAVVACTLGPQGRNVGLQRAGEVPRLTSDGDSIVRDIDLRDTYEDMGVKLGSEVAAKIKESAGDGTTTGTLLLRALVTAGLRYIEAGASPITLKRGMEKAVAALVAEIDATATPIAGFAATENIATAAASGDRETGNAIATALERAGAGGVVTIEEGQGVTTSLEVVEGMELDRGYLSPYFCTDVERLTVEMDHPAILLVDKKIASIQELLPILQATAAAGKQLLMVADEISADALATLVLNQMRGTLRVAAAGAPAFGARRRAILEDLAILTGATLISEEVGLNLREATPDQLGSAKRVRISKNKTLIVEGGGKPEAIAGRLMQLDIEREQATSKLERGQIELRRAKLAGGVAVIRVGAASDVELPGNVQRMEDSLNSTQAALESGVVLGGGVALLRTAGAIEGLELAGDEALGAAVVKAACEAPLRQLAENAGLDGSVIVAEVRAAAPTCGFNVLTEKIEDLGVAGIRDPAKVVKAALVHAASTAGVVLLSEALIIEDNED